MALTDQQKREAFEHYIRGKEPTVEEMFEKLNGTVKDSNRRTVITFVVKTYGNEDQLEKTIDKLKREIALQGFDVDVVHFLEGDE